MNAPAAYTYNGDIYCRDCMHETAANWIDLPQALRDQMRNETTEGALDLAAAFWGIDRHDAHSYDSDGFPKAVFDEQTCLEECGDDSCDHEAVECWHDLCGNLGCYVRLCEQ